MTDSSINKQMTGWIIKDKLKYYQPESQISPLLDHFII